MRSKPKHQTAVVGPLTAERRTALLLQGQEIKINVEGYMKALLIDDMKIVKGKTYMIRDTANRILRLLPTEVTP